MLTVKIISAFAAMAMGAALVLVFPGFSPDADAGTPPQVVKTDRLDRRLPARTARSRLGPISMRTACATASGSAAKLVPSG